MRHCTACAPLRCPLLRYLQSLQVVPVARHCTNLLRATALPTIALLARHCTTLQVCSSCYARTQPQNQSITYKLSLAIPSCLSTSRVHHGYITGTLRLLKKRLGHVVIEVAQSTCHSVYANARRCRERDAIKSTHRRICFHCCKNYKCHKL